MSFDVWTMLLQAVNVLVLVWLLSRFFWKPVAQTIASRRAAARALIADAEAQTTAAQKALAEIEAQRAGIEAERKAVLAEARNNADAERAVRIAEATQEADRLVAAATAAIAHERTAAEEDWERSAGALAVDIARRLLATLGDGVAERAFADRLVKTLEALPPTARRAVINGGGRIETISSTPMAEAEQERLRDAIARALDGAPELSFTTDPGLIAGLELRSPHQVIHNSWRADLDRILEDLKHVPAR